MKILTTKSNDTIFTKCSPMRAIVFVTDETSNEMS